MQVRWTTLASEDLQRITRHIQRAISAFSIRVFFNSGRIANIAIVI